MRARANFATLDAKGIVTDRRAGRIPTETCEKLCAMLAAKVKKIGDTQVIIKPGKEHRFVVVFRGKGLEGPLTDADPNREGFAIPHGQAARSRKRRAEEDGEAGRRVLQAGAAGALRGRSRPTVF